MASVVHAQAMAAAVAAMAGVAVDGKSDGKFAQRRNVFFGGDSKRAGFGERVAKLRSKSCLRVVAIDSNSAVAAMEGGEPSIVANADGQRTMVDRMAQRAQQLESQDEEENDRFPVSSSVEAGRDSMQSALQWRCVEANVENDRLHYGRFAVSPFRTGQANTVGIAMRRALLGEVEGAAVTCATFKNVAHEYSAMDGIQETVLDILLNLKEVVIRSNSHETEKAFISTIGPGEVTVGDILLPPSLEIADPSQHIALLTKAVPFDLELEVERDCGYRIADPAKSTDGRFYLDSVFMPVRNANYSVHSFENEDITQEILFLEIWTNGSITPEEALYEAARSLIDLFLPFLQSERKEIANTSENEHGSSTMSYFSSFLPSAEQITKEVTYKHIFIDQLKLPARAYNCLKRANIHTVSDLLDFTQDDLMRIKNFGKKSVEEVLEALRVQFNINLPTTKAEV